jgi:hypothetical protein
MVIARKFRRSNRSAYIIMLSAAWKYVSTDDHNHSEFMVERAPRISAMLGMGSDRVTAFRVAEAIHHHLEELINMEPRFRPQLVIGEATGRIGDLVIESEVKG